MWCSHDYSYMCIIDNPSILFRRLFRHGKKVKQREREKDKEKKKQTRHCHCQLTALFVTLVRTATKGSWSLHLLEYKCATLNSSHYYFPGLHSLANSCLLVLHNDCTTHWLFSRRCQNLLWHVNHRKLSLPWHNTWIMTIKTAMPSSSSSCLCVRLTNQLKVIQRQL